MHPWSQCVLAFYELASTEVLGVVADVIELEKWRLVSQIAIVFAFCTLAAATAGRLRLGNLAPSKAKLLYKWQAQLDHVINVEVASQWKTFFSDSTYD